MRISVEEVQCVFKNLCICILALISCSLPPSLPTHWLLLIHNRAIEMIVKVWPLYIDIDKIFHSCPVFHLINPETCFSVFPGHTNTVPQNILNQFCLGNGLTWGLCWQNVALHALACPWRKEITGAEWKCLRTGGNMKLGAEWKLDF